MELDGWVLLWADVELLGGAEEQLAALRRRAVERVRERLSLENLSINPVVKAMRLLFRARKPGESYQSLRGPFNLEGKPLLCDIHGPLDCPIAGNEKVKVTAGTRRAWLVVYLPSETATAASACDVLQEQVRTAPVVRILDVAAS